MSDALQLASDLVPVPARVRIDRALALLRDLPARELWAGLWPGGLLALLAVALYFVERVEGVRSLRPLFALLFTLAFLLRCVRVARWSGRRVEALLAAEQLPAQHGQTLSIVRAACWVGVDLWLWLWLLVLAVHIEPWLALVLLPSFALRAALMPTFLASADAADAQTGFEVVRRAIEESDGQGMAAMVCELMLLCGALGLAFNLGAVLLAGIGLGQDILGLDLSLVRAFMSPRNYFALLVITGVSLVAMEPLRATLSALLFVEARLTRDGLGLRVLVSRCLAQPPGRAGRLVLALVLGLCVQPARAQDSSTDLTVQLCDEVCSRSQAGDAEVNRRVASILTGRVFAEFPADGFEGPGRGLSDLSERFARWLAGLSREEQLASEHTSAFRLPGPTFFVVLAALLAVAAWLLVGPRGAPKVGAIADRTVSLAAHAHSPEGYLAAAREARESDPSAALRSLYLATLLGLSRRGRIRLAPERTNGEYLQDLEDPQERAQLSALTRSFDLVHYGKQPPTPDEVERCLGLAEGLVTGAWTP